MATVGGVIVAVGVGALHVQLAAHNPCASETQISSHAVLQQKPSIPHTHVEQEPPLQLAPPCGAQQSPPGVGVGAGVSVAVGVAQPQLAAQVPSAASAQSVSHTVSQQKVSAPQTQEMHVRESQLGPLCAAQQ
jgi:hypothetical protein